MDQTTTFLDQLNESQREAVTFCDGPSLVVAGAGSGKTRVLTYKIAYLLHQGIAPEQILALTFTNKAAREMKARIAKMSDEGTVRRLWMGTFHSIFYRILRREAEVIGYPKDFTIYDTSDSKSLIRSIIKEMQLDEKSYRPTAIQRRISNAKNALITASAYERNKEMVEYDQRSKVPQFRDIYMRYQARCFKAGAMDFDEILLQTNLLFRDHPEVLQRYQAQFNFVLVDEYQDTNFAQHLIVTRLTELNHRICVVGDDAQSIYSFRGANIDNMLLFKEKHPDCRLFKLERNYRSTQNIVNAANSLIAKNKGQIPKRVYSENEEGSKLRLFSSYSEYEEGYLIASQIVELRMQKQKEYADFAVLYRTNAQSRIIEEALRKRNIPYRVYGSQSFYQRKEIKDVIAYFRMIVNPHDEESLKRIINYPARGIGETTVRKLSMAAVDSGVSFWEVLSSPANYGVSIHSGTTKKLNDFRMMISSLINDAHHLPAQEVAELTISRSGIADMLVADRSVESISKQENIQEILNAVADFCANKNEEGESDNTLGDFLTEVSLITDQDEEKDDISDKVTLMTVHSAKGLEFDYVIIAGMENNLFPSSMAMDSPSAIEEERRLLYVAITRAKQHCVMTYAQNRFRNGENTVCYPSPFLDDIDLCYLQQSQPRQNKKRDDQWQSTSSRSSQAEKSQPQLTHTFKKLSPQMILTTENGSDLLQFKEGDMVEHAKFGRGTILSVEGAEGNARAFIEFEYVGTKTLLLKYAKLIKIEDSDD